MNSKIGQVLLWAGFLSGALATVFATATWSRLDFTVKDRPFFTIAEPSEAEQKKNEESGEAKLSELPLPLNARLLKIGDKEIKSMENLEAELIYPITITYREDVGFKAPEWPAAAKETTIQTSNRKNLLELLGQQFKAKQNSELTIDKIEEDSSAWNAGLREGIVISGIEEKRSLNASGFNKMLGGLTGEKVNLKFLSEDGASKSAAIELGSPWATINWLWYALSAVTCIVGIVTIQMSKKSGADQSGKTHANLKQITGNLDSLVAKVQSLNDQIKDYKPRQILTYIEDELADDFRDFADGRDSITAEHGLEVFAQVMTQFAAGERAINRAWSASADGYVEEAATCVDRGLAMLKTAKEFLSKA